MNQREFFAALFDARKPRPADLKDQRADRRFAVYRNNVMASLITALADSFPVTRQLVGEQFFRAMAQNFVVAHPPRSRVLAHYGAGFPGFVADFKPAASLAYLADLTRLEWLRLKVLHAADARPLEWCELEARLEHAEALRLRLHSACALLRSRHAVLSIWNAHQQLDADKPEAVDIHRPQSALILRDGLEVVMHELHTGDDCFVEHLLQGADLSEAAEAAATQAARYGAVFEPMAILQLLLRYQLVISVKLKGEKHEPFVCHH